MDIPGAQAWESFSGTAAVVIFLSSLLSAIGGAVAWKAWLFRRSEARPIAESPATTPSDPSPEALALMETTQALATATQTLVTATEAIAARSEGFGRLHNRLDDVDRDIGATTAEVAELKGQLIQMNNTLTLIHEHLLNK